MCGLFVPYWPGFAFATHHCRGADVLPRCWACTVTMAALRHAATVTALCKRFISAPVSRSTLRWHSLPRRPEADKGYSRRTPIQCHTKADLNLLRLPGARNVKS